MSLFNCPNCHNPFENCTCEPTPPPKPKTKIPKIKCEYCGKRFIDIESHYINCAELIKQKSDQKIKSLQDQINNLKIMIENLSVEKISPGSSEKIYKIADFELEKFKKLILKEYDLEKYDRFVDVDGKQIHLLWSLKKLKELHPDIKEDGERYKVIQLFNLMYRGHDRQIAFVINFTKRWCIKELKS